MSTELWILESLGDNDSKTGCALRDAVMDRNHLSKRKVEVKLRKPQSVTEFYSNLSEVLASAQTGNFPILHIEAHGNEDGLGLANDEFLGWENLSAPLVQINQSSRGFLPVTISACFGAHLAKVALHDVRSPFLVAVGPTKEIFESDLLSDYTEFYFEFDKTRSLTKSRWAINAFGSAGNSYCFTTAESVFLQLHEKRLNTPLSSIDKEQRIQDLVVRLTLKDQSVDYEAARVAATKTVEDFLELSWKKWFYVDLYPDNAHLFPYRFAGQ